MNFFTTLSEKLGFKPKENDEEREEDEGDRPRERSDREAQREGEEHADGRDEPEAERPRVEQAEARRHGSHDSTPTTPSGCAIPAQASVTSLCQDRFVGACCPDEESHRAYRPIGLNGRRSVDRRCCARGMLNTVDDGIRRRRHR